ncbi:MAG: NAD-dependent epimerase/dehydratase family protein [Lachnospiraceae bacterium]|nr:NAD-dependent epimerase/dehydratase family protein [Lachnospiraceae bacterium]
MKEALFIGGTGTISMAITRLLASGNEWHLTLLNRGTRMGELPRGVDAITVDINDEATTAAVLEGKHFDTVCDFIGFVPAQVERDFRLFNGKTDQFMYISSASAYNKLPADCVITEGTTLANPYWEYSRNKIACEDFLMKKYREEGFPVTIIRPSHTYDDRSVPLGVHGAKGSYQVIKRMLDGKPVIIHGDGTSLWTMTFNEDFAKGFVGLMANPHAIGEAFQITNDEHLTWNQIYQTIAKVLGVELKPYYVSSKFLADVGRQYDFTGSLIGDKANTVIFDNSKLKRAVPDFNPSIRFEEGIRRCLDNVLLNPALQNEDPEFDRWCDKVIAGLEAAKRNITNQP